MEGLVIIAIVLLIIFFFAGDSESELRGGPSLELFTQLNTDTIIGQIGCLLSLVISPIVITYFVFMGILGAFRTIGDSIYFFRRKSTLSIEISIYDALKAQIRHRDGQSIGKYRYEWTIDFLRWDLEDWICISKSTTNTPILTTYLHQNYGYGSYSIYCMVINQNNRRWFHITQAFSFSQKGMKIYYKNTSMF
jgi:hypothetical protein